MTSQSWNNPWKLTAIGMALVVATALATGLVVANRSGRDTEPKQSSDATAPSRPAARGAGTFTSATSAAPAAPVTSSVPPQSVIAACNQAAASQVASRDKTIDTVKDGAIGAVAGAVLGAAGGAIAGGGSGAGKGAAIGGLVGAGGGTLYGLNENHKHDERYREAYTGCMRSRGYVG